MSNNIKIRARINALEQKLKRAGNTLGKEAGLGNGTVDGWSDNQIEKSNAVVEKFLTHHRIRLTWWKTGEGEIFNTDVPNTTSNTENLSEEAMYRNLVEANTDYRLVPKTVLDGEYRMMLKSEIELKEKMLFEVINAKNSVITQLEREITELRSGQRVMHPKNA